MLNPIETTFTDDAIFDGPGPVSADVSKDPSQPADQGTIPNTGGKDRPGSSHAYGE